MMILLMKLLEESIRISYLVGETKLTLWTVCSVIFFGAFLINKLVSKNT